jgi:hypothetical protein
VTLWAFFYPHPFLYFWLIFGYLGVIAIPLTFILGKRKQTLRIEGGELVVTGIRTFSRREVRIHKSDLTSLTLENYDEESFHTLNIWKKGGLISRFSLARFIHPQDLRVIFEEIAAFLRGHGFEFEEKNRVSPEEGWATINSHKKTNPTFQRIKKLLRNIVGIISGVIIIFLITTLFLFAVSTPLYQMTPLLYFPIILVILAFSFFIGGYCTARITRTIKRYDVLTMSIICNCLLILIYFSLKKDFEAIIFIPFWFRILLQIYLVFLIYCALFGGKTVKRKLKYRENKGAVVRMVSGLDI